MRQLGLAAVATGMLVAAVLVIQAMIVPRWDAGYVDAAHTESLSMIRLDVDRSVATVGHSRLVPGAAFRYAFRVTNTGVEPVRHLAVRSEGLDARTVSDPACSGRGEVDCLFASLGPGASRLVRVEAGTSPARKAGDKLIIRTYLGRYVRAPDGASTFDILGGWQETSATFAALSG